MHSPLASERVFVPIDAEWGERLGISAAFIQQWGLPDLPEVAQGQTPLLIAIAYLIIGLMFIVWHRVAPPTDDGLPLGDADVNDESGPAAQ